MKRLRAEDFLGSRGVGHASLFAFRKFRRGNPLGTELPGLKAQGVQAAFGAVAFRIFGSYSDAPSCTLMCKLKPKGGLGAMSSTITASPGFSNDGKIMDHRSLRSP